MTIFDIARKTRFNYCIGCGRCTGACPIAEYVDNSFSPRTIIKKLNLGIDVAEDILKKCNLCGEFKADDVVIEASKPRCVANCPHKVNFSGFITLYRRQKAS